MNTELQEAIKAGNGERIAALVDANPDLLRARNRAGTSAVLFAMYCGKPAIAELLVQRGAELDLFEACAIGSLTRVRELVTPDNVNASSHDGFHPLSLACYFSHEEVVSDIARNRR